VTEPLSGVRPAEERAATSGGLLRAVPLGTRPETRGQALQLPPLMLGQRLAAEVVGQLPGGRYLIAVQGALLEATAPQTLRTGSTLNVRVHQLQPQIIFQMDPEPEDDLQAEVEQILRARLPHQTPSGEALQGLRQALSSAGGAALQGVPRELLARLQGLLERLFPHGATPDLDFLLRVLRDGGLHYEAKLAHLAGQDPRALAGLVDTDLKAALLQALKELQAAPMNAQMQRLAGVLRASWIRSRPNRPPMSWRRRVGRPFSSRSPSSSPSNSPPYFWPSRPTAGGLTSAKAGKHKDIMCFCGSIWKDSG